ncbi:MAG: M24 family metallopeptidase [Oscillospiraceae bacterium]|nr:M24 family metallopeptidase [Oscillospiraceae bacterium]
MSVSLENVVYTKVPVPETPAPAVPVDITAKTFALRHQKVVDAMKADGFDALFLYADREHAANFGYLTGFEPRFEESVLILHADGRSFMLLGNESLRMQAYSQLPVTAVHVPHLSLPNQPMGNTETLKELMAKADLRFGMSVGVIGWKMFSSTIEDNSRFFDVPDFLMAPLKELVGAENLKNAAYLLIDADKGVRVINGANDIAHYEFGAALASDRVRRLLGEIEVGKTELELAQNLSAFGQPTSVTTICATGERFTNAVVWPRAKAVAMGDKFSVTLGLHGGLTNRVAYVARTPEDLPEDVRDYVDVVARPYYAGISTWYETVRVGITAGELYAAVDAALPKDKYGWVLNPGHLTSDEEWLSSPVYKDSPVVLKSGMMIQMDIIPKVEGYGGVNAEDGVALADKDLRDQIKAEYPEVWARIESRRKYMIETLGIRLHPDVLPLSNLAGYLRPLLLCRDCALKVVR